MLIPIQITDGIDTLVVEYDPEDPSMVRPVFPGMISYYPIQTLPLGMRVNLKQQLSGTDIIRFGLTKPPIEVINRDGVWCVAEEDYWIPLESGSTAYLWLSVLGLVKDTHISPEVCQCDIVHLWNHGHLPTCPERKRS